MTNPKKMNALEHGRLLTACTAAYLIGYCKWELEDVYRFRNLPDDDNIRCDIVLADYDQILDLAMEYHNGLRTIWRRRRHKWLEPIALWDEAMVDPRRSTLEPRQR